MKSKARKLLVASIGIATVSYVGCGVSDPPTSGNLVGPVCYSEGTCAVHTDAGADAADSGEAGTNSDSGASGDAASDASRDASGGG